MAKNKNKEQRDQKEKQVEAEKEDFTLKDYFYINLFFWGFLVVLSIIVFFTTGGQMDPVMENVFLFIFAVFGGGFTFVSLFDFIYEKVAKKNETQNQ
jgi:uncharacterized membrane-anchored protein